MWYTGQRLIPTLQDGIIRPDMGRVAAYFVHNQHQQVNTCQEGSGDQWQLRHCILVRLWPIPPTL